MRTYCTRNINCTRCKTMIKTCPLRATDCCCMQEAHPTTQPAPQQSQVSVTNFHFTSCCDSNGNYCDLQRWLGGTSFPSIPIIRTGVNPLPSCPLWKFSWQSWPPSQIRSTPSRSPSPSIPSLQHSWAELINLALFEHSLLLSLLVPQSIGS